MSRASLRVVGATPYILITGTSDGGEFELGGTTDAAEELDFLRQSAWALRKARRIVRQRAREERREARLRKAADLGRADAYAAEATA